MKLALAGDSYTDCSLAAAAQQSINLYRESIENTDGSGKGPKYLRGAPGYTQFVNLNAHSGVVRALFSCANAVGGARLFVIVGQWYYEISEAGSTVSSYDLGSNTTAKAQMFGNGNQLGIVSSNQFYLDNGAGPIKARFALHGTLAIAGTAVTWVSGDKFPIYTPGTADPLPTVAYINDSPVVITFTSATTATLAVALAGGSGTATLYGDSGDVFWSSGAQVFDLSWVGMQIDLDGIIYTITAVLNPYRLQIAERPGGITYGVAWTVTVANNTYSTAGGPLVTAVTGAYLDEQFYVQRPAYPQHLYTDLVIGATNTQITSAAFPFSQADVGSVITITSGTGFTLQTIQILSVATVTATADRAVGTAASTGGHGFSTDLGRQVNFSAVLDGTSWNSLDFFTKESAPDYIQSIYADRGQLYLFGQEASEIWQNSTSTGRPERVNGAEIAEGSASRYGVVSMNGHVYFIGGPPGGAPVAYRLDGYTPTRVSTHAIEESWETNLSDVASAVSWWYMEDGHYFWVIAFANPFGTPPSAWVYDATERSWHERMGWNGTALISYLFQSHTFIKQWNTGSSNGRHLIGGPGTSKVYYMSSALYSADGSDVKYVRAMPYLFNGGKRIFVGRVQLSMDTGEIPSGTEPTIQLDWSDDNGHTFGTPESAGFGTHGQYNKQVYWLAQGSFESSAIPRLSYLGQQQITLIDVDAEVTYGTS